MTLHGDYTALNVRGRNGRIDVFDMAANGWCRSKGSQSAFVLSKGQRTETGSDCFEFSDLLEPLSKRIFPKFPQNIAPILPHQCFSFDIYCQLFYIFSSACDAL